MIQAMITPLKAELAAVAELDAKRGCMAACNVKPGFPLCPASIAPACNFNISGLLPPGYSMGTLQT